MKHFLIFCVTLAFTFFPSPSLSQSVPLEGQEGPRISMDLKDANIKDVLKILSQQAGMNFVASEDIQDRTLTLYLDRVTVQDALNNIMSANRLEYVQVPGSDIFVVRPRIEEEGADLMMKVYRLKFARVSDSPLEMASTNTASQAAISTTSSGLGGTTAGGGTSGGGASTYTSGGLSIGGPTGMGGGGGLAGAGGGRLAPRGINLVLENLLSLRGSLVTDSRTNSVIITDIPNRFKFFEEAIAKLDRPVSQVIIEAEILETSVNALDDVGVEWGGSTGEILEFVGPTRSTRFPFRKIGAGTPTATFTVGTVEAVDAIVELLKTRVDTKVLSRPRIMTLDNEGAIINVTAETAIATLTISTTAEGTAISESDQAERTTTGISLRVTPQINDDAFVTMTLEPSVVRVERSEFFTQFVDPQRRSAQTTVMVRDGETIVIGGLISTDLEDTKRKVPVLGDIPILGLLFRHTDKDELNRELLVFVTPHIVPTSEVPFAAVSQVPPAPITVTVPEEREQLPLRSKEKEIEEVLNRYSTKP